MNHLAHTLLSWNREDILPGNLFCDMLKPREIKALPTEWLKGIQMHQWIDHYTDTHTVVRQTMKILQHGFGKYSPVALDIYFDHFLASKWNYFSDSEYEEFCTAQYSLIAGFIEKLPDRLHSRIYGMIQNKWLHSFKSIENLQITFDFLVHRAKFINNFSQASAILEAHYFELEGAFMEFFPELAGYTKLRMEEL